MQLRLYVSGSAGSSRRAVATLEALTSELQASHDLEVEVIDVLAMPERAARDRITLTPTLLSCTPGLVSRLTGELPEPSELARHLGLAHMMDGV